MVRQKYSRLLLRGSRTPMQKYPWLLPRRSRTTIQKNPALSLWRSRNNRRSPLINMPTAFDQVPPLGHGHKDKVFGILVNERIRPALAGLSKDLRLSTPPMDWAVTVKKIRLLEEVYDPLLLCRAIIESCNQEFGDDNYFRFLAMRLLLPYEYYLAVMIFKFFSNDRTQVLVDVICSLKSSEIPQIKNIYRSLFKSQLEAHIEAYTLGNTRKLLLRHTSDPAANASVGEERLKDIVSYLHEIVEQNHNWPHPPIMDCVYELNEEDLRIVANLYSTQYGKSLAEDLTRAGYGHFEHGLITKIRCAVNRPDYFAEELKEAFGEMIVSGIEESMDVDHCVRYETIVRVITTMTMEERMMMEDKYNSPESDLGTDISAAFANRRDYRHLILTILNPCP